MLDSVSIGRRSSVASAPGLDVRAGDPLEHSHDLVEVLRALERLADRLGPGAEALDREIADALDLRDRSEVREQERSLRAPRSRIRSIVATASSRS